MKLQSEGISAKSTIDDVMAAKFFIPTKRFRFLLWNAESPMKCMTNNIGRTFDTFEQTKKNYSNVK